jgi:hypothetical protein
VFAAIERWPVVFDCLPDEVRGGSSATGGTSFRTTPEGVVSRMPASWQSSRTLAYCRLSFCRRRRAFDVR